MSTQHHFNLKQCDMILHIDNKEDHIRNIAKNGSTPFKHDELFIMAERINPKRKFLFVSKLLGRHIPVDVNDKNVETAYQSLAQKYIQICQENNILNAKTLFISMAETATQMAIKLLKAIDENCPNQNLDILAIHSTRQPIDNVPILCAFEESHSHATTHYLHEIKNLEQYQNIVLIDDEFSSGNMVVNCIKILKEKGANPQNLFSIAFLDWRTDTALETLSEHANCNIHTISLINGSFTTNDKSTQVNDEYHNEVIDPKSIQFKGKTKNNKKDVLKTGIHITQCQNIQYKHEFDFSIPQVLEKKLKKQENNILVVSAGENHFATELIGKDIAKMNKVKTVKICSITRSPILCQTQTPNYPIKQKLFLQNNYGFNEVINHLYNVDFKQYDHIVFVLECDLEYIAPQILEWANQYKNISIVYNTQLTTQ